MSELPVLVLRAAGINCDEETVHGWRLAGAAPVLLHVDRVIERPALLRDFRILTVPGGFSYGDDLGAGVILGQRMALHLAGPIREFVERGGGVFGVCNGFQVLVKMGLLPGGRFEQRVTVTYNDSAKFEARWVKMDVCTDRCPFLSPGGTLELPVEHGEGKVVTADAATADQLVNGGYVALRYVDENGRSDTYPANPNGSVAGIAGLCDETGRVFGLMPHPDRFLDPTQHPLWTRRGADASADGLQVFRNAVAHWS